MKTLKATAKTSKSGFLFNNFDEVKVAMHVYLNGGTSATEANLLQHGGPLGFGLRFMAQNGSQNSFLENMYSRLSRGLTSRGRGSVDYDYDGVGPFHKTGVTIVKAANGEANDVLQESIVLTMNAAYVGNGCEQGLSDALKQARGISSEEVTIQFEADNEDYATIDCDYLAEKLTETGFVEVTGEELRLGLVPTESYPGTFNHKISIPGTALDVSIAATWDSLQAFDTSDRENIKENFTINENKVTVRRMLNTYEKPHKIGDFAFKFTVSKRKPENSYQTLPIFDEDTQKKMVGIRDLIAEKLS